MFCCIIFVLLFLAMIAVGLFGKEKNLNFKI